MRKYPKRLSLLLVAVLVGALALGLSGLASALGGVASAAPGRTLAAASASASASVSTKTSGPTLTWDAPLSNTAPVGFAGETVTIDGSGFSANSQALLTLQQGNCPSTITLNRTDKFTAVSNTGLITPHQLSIPASPQIAKVGAAFSACAYSPPSTGNPINLNQLSLITGTTASLKIVATSAPQLTITGATVVQPGHAIILTGAHWDASQSVTITFTNGFGTPIPHTPTQRIAASAMKSSSSGGSFSSTITAPTAPGTYTLSATADGGALTAQTTVTIQSSGGGSSGNGSSLSSFVPEMFWVIIALVVVMIALFLWLATRRAPSAGSQF